MKVTDPDVIKAGERDLIESIKDDLDWNVIKDVFLQNIKSPSFDIKDGALSFDVNGGEIFVHGGEIAFRVDLQLKTEMTIIFDRKGNYIPDRESSSYEYDTDSDEQKNDNIDDEIDDLELDTSSEDINDDEIQSDIESEIESDIESDIDSMIESEIDSSTESNIDSEQLIDEVLLDDISSLEDEDILGEMTEQDTVELDSIAELNKLTKDDDIEDILKESRDFWRTEEK
ncbi:MAG: hypothetical protein HQK73_02210 [Desulfamplus sp.]|nr:hypothetical protein [Desulfamplus sp.]